MKKSIHILVLAIFLSGCSALHIVQLVPSPHAPPPLDSDSLCKRNAHPHTKPLCNFNQHTAHLHAYCHAIGAELFTPTNTETPLPTVWLPPR